MPPALPGRALQSCPIHVPGSHCPHPGTPPPVRSVPRTPVPVNSSCCRRPTPGPSAASLRCSRPGALRGARRRRWDGMGWYGTAHTERIPKTDPHPLPCPAAPSSSQTLPRRALRIPRAAKPRPSSALAPGPLPLPLPASPAQLCPLPALPGSSRCRPAPSGAGARPLPGAARAHQDEGAAHRLRHALPQLGRRARLAEPLRELPHFRHGDMIRSAPSQTEPRAPFALPRCRRAGAAGPGRGGRSRGAGPGGSPLCPAPPGPALSLLQVARSAPRHGESPGAPPGQRACSSDPASEGTACRGSAEGRGLELQNNGARGMGHRAAWYNDLPALPGVPARLSWIQDKSFLLSISVLVNLSG